MATTAEKNQTEKELTPEEIKERRGELIKFYEEELPLLEKRLEYEEFITKIEEAKFARFQIQVAKAQMLSPNLPEEGPFEESVSTTKERTLKKS